MKKYEARVEYSIILLIEVEAEHYHQALELAEQKVLLEMSKQEILEKGVKPLAEADMCVEIK
ncbi:MAG: hypothetical protein K9M13_02050 [Simkaniaceae bacterium]|nr:hypothetical protein [Simkaniaceae bacterium]